MKKVIILLFALSILTYGCGGGGGAGSADLPPGENPGIPSVVQLLPSQYVAQTNAYITLNAKVMDGNGAPVSNIDVTFTNSGVGTLSHTSARTDGKGLAQVTITSSTPGFSTILAQINTASGVVRDRKSIYFSTDLLIWPLPSLSLDVDGDNDGIFNEQNDFTVFEGVNDNQVLIRATVFDEFGQAVPSSTVSFGSDNAEVSFPAGTTANTDINGKAQVLVQVDPLVLRSYSTVINITAEADNGAANMVSLFLNPVTISSITVTASPTQVVVNDTATIIASVSTSIGTPAPDGTVVNLSANCGLFSPQGQINPTFPQTTDGMVSSTFTAPSTPTTCEIKATAGGKTGSVFITVIPAE